MLSSGPPKPGWMIVSRTIVRSGPSAVAVTTRSQRLRGAPAGMSIWTSPVVDRISRRSDSAGRPTSSQAFDGSTSRPGIGVRSVVGGALAIASGRAAWRRRDGRGGRRPGGLAGADEEGGKSDRGPAGQGSGAHGSVSFVRRTRRGSTRSLHRTSAPRSRRRSVREWTGRARSSPRGRARSRAGRSRRRASRAGCRRRSAGCRTAARRARRRRRSRAARRRSSSR